MKKIAKTLYSSIPFKKELFSHLKKVWQPSENIYQHLYFKDSFKVKTKAYEFKLYHFGNLIENQIFWGGIENGYENQSLKIWAKLCENAHTILDIGSNTGIYSLIAKAVNSKARVLAFEPVYRVYNKLRKNNHINNFDIECYDLALSNYDGTAKIYDVKDEHVYSVTINKNYLKEDIPTIEVNVPVKRLDTFIKEKELKEIDLIKIDVETHEPEVLEGMGDYLKQFKPALLVEILSENEAKKIAELVKDIDYVFYDINENGKITKMEQPGKSSSFNYLICSESIARKTGLPL